MQFVSDVMEGSLEFIPLTLIVERIRSLGFVDECHKGKDVEGLRHIRDGAGLHEPLCTLVVCISRHHHNGDPALHAEVGENIFYWTVGQIHIKEHDRKTLSPRDLQALVTRRSRKHLISGSVPRK